MGFTSEGGAVDDGDVGALGWIVDWYGNGECGVVVDEGDLAMGCVH